jgi:transcriptional regulator with XRE-family HTH domain
MQLGKKIRELRFRRGLTVQQLAELSGLSKGFISQVENERTSPRSRPCAISRVR